MTYYIKWTQDYKDIDLDADDLVDVKEENSLDQMIAAFELNL